MTAVTAVMVMLSGVTAIVLVELNGGTTELDIRAKKPPMPTQKATSRPAASPITAP